MPAHYTRDTLTAAVARSTTLSDVVTALGGRPTDGSRRYARRLLSRWGIDASHLQREGVRHTESRLRKAVADSTSTAGVLRHLGISPVGGNHAHIGRRLTALGISTDHFTGRSHSGRRVRRSPLVLGSPTDGRAPGERLRRALLSIGVPETCAECRTGPVWNGRPLRLQVDHVNGDWWDNRPLNLRLLCPNCHAVTDTFRGRKGRPSMEGNQ
ncbi:HNH endonuclease family protein [Streptomyces sparsus]